MLYTRTSRYGAASSQNCHTTSRSVETPAKRRRLFLLLVPGARGFPPLLLTLPLKHFRRYSPIFPPRSPTISQPQSDSNTPFGHLQTRRRLFPLRTWGLPHLLKHLSHSNILVRTPHDSEYWDVLGRLKGEVKLLLLLHSLFAAFSSFRIFILLHSEHKHISRKWVIRAFSQTLHLYSSFGFLGVQDIQVPSSRYLPTSFLPHTHSF